MARPVKLNADYFPHDADMRNDPKIKAVRRKFGHVGYSVWVMLLEFLTDSDNFQFDVSELQFELISGDFDVEPDKLKEIIEYLKTVRLIHQKDGFIYSIRHKERFSTLINKRKRDRRIIIDVENPQSKVKESKVNKSKVKEIEKSISTEPQKINFSDLESEQWFMSIRSFLDNKINYQVILDYWKKYQQAMIADDDLYREKNDYKSHFRNWVKIQVEKNGSRTGLLKPTGILTD